MPDSGRIYAGESAAERLVRQRRRFMDAGLELFGTIGYRATSVRALCRQAGLIDRYFYKTFDGTEALLAAVYTEQLDRIEGVLMRAIQAAIPSGDPRRVAREGLDAFFGAIEDPRVARITWLEVLGVSPRIDALYTARIERFATLLVGVGQALLPGIVLSAEEMRYVGIAMVGAVSGSAMLWLMSGYAAKRESIVAANTRVLAGVASNLAADLTAKNGVRVVFPNE